MTRGGKRKGAGRHQAANKKTRYTVRFRPEQIKWMRDNIKARGKNAFIREAVDEKIERIMDNESSNNSKS